MAHWKKAFPSRYLQVSDLDDGPIIATIKSVGTENVGGGEDAELKLVVKFYQDVRPLVCNLTRAQSIAVIAGSEDTEHWPSTTIQIVKGTTIFKGKRVACIVVQAPPKTTTRPVVASSGDIDDAVPF